MNKKYKYNVVTFDFETYLFNDEFKKATTIEERLKHIPKPKLCCVCIY
ncbi:MAG: hypothetical protein M1481_00235 [Candidatus Thermoplasmatota archaeon]|nr:hypothetical protein [Candidatus Thermoplasmatota archaeon]MCL5963884.1 hypothetical protein [Candidatus Thermoplasmatota archaeon]